MRKRDGHRNKLLKTGVSDNNYRYSYIKSIEGYNFSFKMQTKKKSLNFVKQIRCVLNYLKLISNFCHIEFIVWKNKKFLPQ